VSAAAAREDLAAANDKVRDSAALIDTQVRRGSWQRAVASGSAVVARCHSRDAPAAPAAWWWLLQGADVSAKTIEFRHFDDELKMHAKLIEMKQQLVGLEKDMHWAKVNDATR